MAELVKDAYPARNPQSLTYVYHMANNQAPSFSRGQDNNIDVLEVRVVAPGIVLVRHGDDAPGAGDDPPLSAAGRAQAEALAAQLVGYRFDVLFTSPRKRTRETAAILGASLGVTPVVQARLRDVPEGLRALPSLVWMAGYARRLPRDRRVLVVTHGGTLRALLLFLDGWRQLPRPWSQVPYCRPFVARRQYASLAGPLALLTLGMLLGLVFAPGPWPGALTWLSVLAALATGWFVARLAHKGHSAAVVVGLALATLVVWPLSYGPSPLQNRKVTAFNAWAYRLGAHLPVSLPQAPHPNGVAGALAVTVGLVGGVALHTSGYRRWLGGMGLVLNAGALFLTASRAGWLAGAAALIAVACSRGRRLAVATLAFCGLAAIVVLVLAGPPAAGQPALTSVESLGLRSEQWRQTLSLLRAQPLTGLGLRRFPSAYAQAVALSGGRAFKTPNNALLELWADAGLLGLAACVWIVARARHTLTALAGQRHVSPNGMAVGVQAALLAMVVDGLFETNTAYVWATGAGFAYLASPLPFVLLGLLLGLQRRSLDELAGKE